MKKKMLTLAAAAAIAATSAAHANTVTLDVKGSVIPSACTVTLDGNGEVNFGDISSHRLNATTPTNIGSKTIGLSVTCLAKNTYVLFATDDRAATVDSAAAAVAKPGTQGAEAYGLGSTDKGNIGAYVLSLGSGEADNTAATFIRSTDKTTWSDTTLLVADQSLVAWTTQGMTPVAASTSSATLTVDAAVVGTDSLDLTSSLSLDGRATIELSYL